MSGIDYCFCFKRYRVFHFDGTERYFDKECDARNFYRQISGDTYRGPLAKYPKTLYLTTGRFVSTLGKTSNQSNVFKRDEKEKKERGRKEKERLKVEKKLNDELRKEEEDEEEDEHDGIVEEETVEEEEEEEEEEKMEEEEDEEALERQKLPSTIKEAEIVELLKDEKDD
jgi:hypothetical protein